MTASSHGRAFLVEVMGRDCGYLTLMVGIASGAEAIVIPEIEVHPEEVARELRLASERALIVVDFPNEARIPAGILTEFVDIADKGQEHERRTRRQVCQRAAVDGRQPVDAATPA